MLRLVYMEMKCWLPGLGPARFSLQSGLAVGGLRALVVCWGGVQGGAVVRA
jgi:hypothetical protein